MGWITSVTNVRKASKKKKKCKEEIKEALSLMFLDFLYHGS